MTVFPAKPYISTLLQIKLNDCLSALILHWTSCVIKALNLNGNRVVSWDLIPKKHLPVTSGQNSLRNVYFVLGTNWEIDGFELVLQELVWILKGIFICVHRGKGFNSRGKKVLIRIIEICDFGLKGNALYYCSIFHCVIHLHFSYTTKNFNKTRAITGIPRF